MLALIGTCGLMVVIGIAKLLSAIRDMEGL